MEQIADKELKELQKRLNTDVDFLLKLIQAEKKILALETQMAIIGGFLLNYLETMEGFFDTDESSLSWGHMDEYVRAAKYMRDVFGRGEGRIKQMEANMLELPCQNRLPSKDELVSMIKELVMKGEQNEITYDLCERARTLTKPFER